MPLTGKQKAAMLLTTLDVATATELLRGFDAQVVEELAVELSYLDAAGLRNRDEITAVSQEFTQNLRSERGFEVKSFLDDMLKNTLGQNRAEELLKDIQSLLRRRDPFLPVLKADIAVLASVLDTEHPQAVAVVLSELPPKRSSDVLGMLNEGVRLSAVSRMTSVGAMPREAKARIADMVGTKLEIRQSEGGDSALAAAKPEDSLRKVSLILRNLEKDQRDQVLASVRKKDSETSDAIMDMMVLWEDLHAIHDRSMQEGLRGLDEQALAQALHKADEAVAHKIKSNISARAASMVEEEAALMGTPKKSDVSEAQTRILTRLRELNRNGDLMWQDQES